MTNKSLLAVEVRKKRGSRTMKDVACELDVNPKSIARWERGTVPRQLIGVVARWLGVTEERIFEMASIDASCVNVIQVAGNDLLSAIDRALTARFDSNTPQGTVSLTYHLEQIQYMRDCLERLNAERQAEHLSYQEHLKVAWSAHDRAVARANILVRQLIEANKRVSST